MAAANMATANGKRFIEAPREMSGECSHKSPITNHKSRQDPPVRLAVVLVSLLTLAGAQAPKPDEVVARVYRYASDYGGELANVVAEETYRQRAPQARGPARIRTLRSDYALTWVGPREGLVWFRDTFEVDGL